MRNKKTKIFVVVLVLALLLAAWYINRKNKNAAAVAPTKVINPFYGEIHNYVSSTGTVLPQNRLEVKPSISGRVEQILVAEGDTVRKGQTLAWMSSTERAALLDAARAQGPEAVKYWQEAYKATPLIAPISGEVIVKSVEPGQTVTTAEPVVVLSDRLIVKGQFDETDIGKLKLGQSVRISLDAYPEIKANGKIDHISYESTLVSNVNIYEVDILPVKTPPVFRSGMSANVNVLVQSKDNVLLIPLAAVKSDKEGTYVLLDKGQKDKPVKQKIEQGITNDVNTEVVSGLTTEDKVIMAAAGKTSKTTQGGTNPFLPTPRRGR
jgi:membrane fusion protein, macrolide-specific efflux system